MVTPTRHDSVARSASQLLGGPLGKYADPLARGWRRLAAVLAGPVSYTHLDVYKRQVLGMPRGGGS